MLLVHILIFSCYSPRVFPPARFTRASAFPNLLILLGLKFVQVGSVNSAKHSCVMALQKYKDQAVKFLNEKNAVTDVLAMVEEKTGAPRLYVAGGG